jgi:hypothetical protein
LKASKLRWAELNLPFKSVGDPEFAKDGIGEENARIKGNL